MKQNTYSKRVLTATVLTLLIGALTYLGGLYFLLLICAISLVAGGELYALFVPGGLNVRKEFLMGFVLLILAGAHMGIEYFLAALYAASAGVFLINLLKERKDISGYVKEIGMSLAFITLLGTMMGSAVLLRNVEEVRMIPDDWVDGSFLKNGHGFFFVAMAFICGALNDSAAYFIGGWRGKRKIVSNISPGKTLEGGVAGIVAATATGLLLNSGFGSPLPILPALVFGLFAGLSSVAGDLVESAVKRNCNAKDSGALLPGHGGFFDRFDGMIFVFPTFYVLIFLL